MKSFFLTLVLALSLPAFADYPSEGQYESGSCSTAQSRENADSVYESGVPILGSLGGRKFQVNCCRQAVERACGQSFQEMANTNKNGETWAVCMRSVAIQRNTNEHGSLPELASDCQSQSCRDWADDCRDLGVSDLRDELKESYPQRGFQY